MTAIRTRVDLLEEIERRAAEITEAERTARRSRTARDKLFLKATGRGYPAADRRRRTGERRRGQVRSRAWNEQREMRVTVRNDPTAWGVVFVGLCILVVTITLGAM